MQKDMEDPFAAFEGKELYELTATQATELLNAFLATEEVVFRDLKIEGVALDYSRDSVVRLFEYVVTQEFDRTNIKGASNKDWYLRLAYYFGESLRRTSNHLHWAIGRKNRAQENHPVITGFADKTQAPLTTVARNSVEVVAIDGEPFARIESVVDFWYDAARK
jgi:hypothetical protein